VSDFGFLTSLQAYSHGTIDLFTHTYDAFRIDQQIMAPSWHVHEESTSASPYRSIADSQLTLWQNAFESFTKNFYSIDFCKTIAVSADKLKGLSRVRIDEEEELECAA
jgi:hypothetical protein